MSVLRDWTRVVGMEDEVLHIEKPMEKEEMKTDVSNSKVS